MLDDSAGRVRDAVKNRVETGRAMDLDFDQPDRLNSGGARGPSATAGAGRRPDNPALHIWRPGRVSRRIAISREQVGYRGLYRGGCAKSGAPLHFARAPSAARRGA